MQYHRLRSAPTRDNDNNIIQIHNSNEFIIIMKT